MLISVHIPKTGGSSFKKILEGAFNEKILFDYNDKPMTKNDQDRNYQAEIFRLNENGSISEYYECIHGHFLPTKYLIPGKKHEFITWVRDPLQRVISRYNHGKRNKDSDIVKKKLSLENFCEIERYHNIYNKYLWNFELSNFSFIGITENYAVSLEVFKKQFSIPFLQVEYHNVNKEKPVEEKYFVDDRIRRLIYETNHLDYDIYYEAIEINKRLQNKYL